MITFIGDFECKADVKGRVVMPAAFKKALGVDDARFVVRKDLFEKCLVIYPYTYWEEELVRLRSRLNSYNRAHKQFLRDFFRGSAEVMLDANGRILIPKRLMDSVEAGREVVLVGVDRCIELWSLDIYQSMGDESERLAGQAELFLSENGRSDENLDS
ncbi:division/cell wall cluster transcriptional repressor MraZ [Geofilum sp. OHC36d9]|uniref:division/cell wall cluster transcriptional repressor MraZ n=1 Tax=Geofilum sp. OHC36d9 TaxID=3458413 RepID=UPI0040344E01